MIIIIVLITFLPISWSTLVTTKVDQMLCVKIDRDSDFS